MSEKYKVLPSVQVVVPIGFQKYKSEKDLHKFIEEARIGLSLIYLEQGKTAWSRWQNVERIFVVREEQSDILTEDVIDPRYKRIIMPNECSQFASDRREFIRRGIPLKKGVVRINADADIRAISTNLTYEDAWKTDPQGFSRYIGIWILKFLEDYEKYGVTFAGFNDRENRPGTVAGLYSGFINENLGVAQYGYGYFKEALTFEMSDCPGAYPKGWDLKEGAYRILDTIRCGGKIARYLSVVNAKARKPIAYEHENTLNNLIEEFGKDVVLSKPPNGLNFQSSGKNRNKFRRIK